MALAWRFELKERGGPEVYRQYTPTTKTAKCAFCGTLPSIKGKPHLWRYRFTNISAQGTTNFTFVPLFCSYQCAGDWAEK